MIQPYWKKCPFCRLYFQPETIVVKIKNDRKFKYFICPRCGNEFSGGFYNKARDGKADAILED